MVKLDMKDNYLKKILFFLVLSITITSCSIGSKKNLIATHELVNVSLDKVIDEFGFPNDEKEILDKKVFEWETKDWVGSKDSDYTEANCILQITINENKIVTYATLNGMICHKYRRKINKIIKPSIPMGINFG